MAVSFSRVRSRVWRESYMRKIVSSPHIKLMEYKDESMSKDAIQETFSFIWDCQHRKGEFHLEQRNNDTEKQLHASQKKKWSRLRLSNLKRGIHNISMVPTIFPNPLFWNAFRKPTDVRMPFTRWHELCWCSMVGLQECQPLAVENDSTSSLLSLGPKSTPKFPGVCYDGAAGDGVLCRFEIHTSLMFFF